MITKNRVRDEYTFANINLLGKCNANCYFCLGKDIEKELRGKNQLTTHFSEWRNFPHFLNLCKQNKVKNLYLTGQTADGLQYQYLQEIVDYLQGMDFIVGVRTNGLLALRKMEEIRSMKGEIGYSIHTLRNDINRKIMGRDVPDWGNIIPQSGENVRVSIVVNRYNIDGIVNLIEYLSEFPNIRYIQLRRICTDTRTELLSYDILLFEKYFEDFIKCRPPKLMFAGAPICELCGKDIVFWRTVETTANSLNYFTDGTCSDEYFVVEGYLKNMEKP